MTPALPTLDELDTTVHVVLAAQDAPDVVASLPVLQAVLSPDEQLREHRYRLPADRVRFVVGRGLARHLLGQVLSLAPAAVAIATEAHGRPVLANRQGRDIGFNVSHTSGLVAVALTDTRDVGIDVEDTARAITQDIARRFFSVDEVQALRAHPAAAQASAFFDYWTLKEAYIKARGLGLTIPLDQVSFQVAPNRQPVLRLGPRQADTAGRWQFHLASPTARHRLALAVSRRNTTTRAVRLWWFGARPA